MKPIGIDDLVPRDPEVRVVKLGFYGTDRVSLFRAERLYEYDIILLLPSPALVELNDEDAGSLLEDWAYDRISEELSTRAKEFNAFIARGGLLFVFLSLWPPMRGRLGSPGDPLHPLHFVVPANRLDKMGLAAATGSTIKLFDSEEPLGTYLQKCSGWEATMKTGVLADERHGYPLAESRGHEIVAYAEHLGAGAVYWVPLSGPLPHLIALATSLWRQGQMVLDDAEKARGLLNQIAATTSSYVAERARLGSELDRARLDYARFVEQHPRLQKIRERFHAASRSSPAKALDYLSRMLELIEEEFGGRKRAETALGIKPEDWSSITSPANDPVLGVRHEATDQDPVPADRLTRAVASATDILDRYVRYLRDEWTKKRTG